MENASKQEISRLDFLNDKSTDDYFAKLDYKLRSGVHIQREHPLSEACFRYLDRNFESLKLYYKELFGVLLTRAGNQFNTYYFIDFLDGGRGNIHSDYREYLRTEYVLIGMLYYKLYKLDGNIELDSVSDFISLLFSEYEEESDSLRKLIMDVSSDKSSDYTDEKLENIITKAFSKFSDLGWIAWEADDEKNRFRHLPSFERLRSLYQSQILAIDELIKSQDDPK